MTIMTEETFGPVIPVMKVKSDEEAVKLMNDSEFGLTASIWTKDNDRGYELAEHVEAGTVFVNRADYPSPVSIYELNFYRHSITNERYRTSLGRVGRTRVLARHSASLDLSHLFDTRIST